MTQPSVARSGTILTMTKMGLVIVALSICIVGTSQAATYLKIGILGEPKALNPFGASDAWTKKISMLLYQPLYMVDPNTQTLIPWLAADQPLYDPKNKTVTFHLRAMKWDDGTPFSADDLVFTVDIIKRFRIPRYYVYWDFVKKIEAIDPLTVRLTVEQIMPVLARRSLTTWVVQKRKWLPLIQKAEEKLKDLKGEDKPTGDLDDEEAESTVSEALRVIQGHETTDPTGLGPFRFKSWKKGSYILMEKNPYFFAQDKIISGRRLGPFIDGIMFKVFDNLSASSLALMEGEIDFLWKGVSHSLVSAMVKDPNIKVPMVLDSGYRFLGFNLRKPPMSDPAFRRAVAYLVDKNFIINRILHNHGEALYTFIPPDNTFYFDPDIPQYGQDLGQKERIKEAYRLLKDAGYRWETPPVSPDGAIQKGSRLSMPDGQPAAIGITILGPPPDYDTEMAACGQVIATWLQDFGMKVSWEPIAFGALLRRIRNERDFDMFVLGWRNLSLDPDYLRRFFHSTYDEANQWNYTGYSNAEYDRLAETQAQTVDLRERRKIIFELQERLTADLPIIPLYVPHLMEGIRTDRFEGWYMGLGGVGNIWTFSMLKAKPK